MRTKKKPTRVGKFILTFFASNCETMNVGSYYYWSGRSNDDSIRRWPNSAYTPNLQYGNFTHSEWHQIIQIYSQLHTIIPRIMPTPMCRSPTPHLHLTQSRVLCQMCQTLSARRIYNHNIPVFLYAVIFGSLRSTIPYIYLYYDLHGVCLFSAQRIRELNARLSCIFSRLFAAKAPTDAWHHKK